MTEKEWQTSIDFDALFEFHTGTRKRSRRVQFLLATAVCRHITPLYPEPACLDVIDLVERVADGVGSVKELPAAHKRIDALKGQVRTRPSAGDLINAPQVKVIPMEALGVLSWLTDTPWKLDNVLHRPEDVCGLRAALRKKVMPRFLPYNAIPDFWDTPEFERGKALAERATCRLLRDILGNPFRKVKFDKKWRSEPAVALAHTAYDTRNFTLLPILADALEEAGCDHPDVLAHCRDSNGVHVRGCWVVDGVLGKQ